MLNDDFDEDDLPGGSLDLEKGSNQVGAGGVASSYGGGGIDFDDELDDGAPLGSLELDIPGGGRSLPPAVPSNAPRAPGPSLPVPGGDTPRGGQGVPDLALGPGPSKAPPPPAQSSGSLPPRTSGGPPSYPSAAHPAPPAPTSSARSLPAGPLGPSSRPGEMAPLSGPPSRPSAASVIAKYPAPPEKIHQAPMYTIRVILRQLELRSDLESLRRRRSPDVPLYEAALKAYEPKTFRLGMAINCAALAVATFVFFLPVILRFVRD